MQGFWTGAPKRVYRKKKRLPEVVAGDPVLSEHEEQRNLVSWFRKTHRDVRIFAIPNGGARGLAAGAKLKVEGVSPGVPDLYVPAWKMWIEMKRSTGGRIDPAQKDWHEYLAGIGDTIIIGRGAEDAKEKILRFIEMEKKCSP